MLGKIIKGHCFAGTLRYLFHGDSKRPKKPGEVSIIDGDMVGRNAKELTREFCYSQKTSETASNEQ